MTGSPPAGRTVAEIASAIGRDVAFVAETFEQFRRAGLVVEVSPGRWALKDGFAREWSEAAVPLEGGPAA